MIDLNKFIFMDFETIGLWGKVTEISIVEINNNKTTMINFENLKDFLKSKFNNKDYFNGKILVVWHPWMLEYMSINKKFRNFYDNVIISKIIIFSDLYAMNDNFSEKRYKIADMTRNLIESEHNGNAADDCMDLYKCFKKLINNNYM